SADRLQILGRRLAGLAVSHDFERHALTFPEFAQSGTLHRANVYEHVLAAALGLDKSIALLRVEPFHGTVVHGPPLSLDTSIWTGRQCPVRFARDFGEGLSVRRAYRRLRGQVIRPKTRSAQFSGKQ